MAETAVTSPFGSRVFIRATRGAALRWVQRIALGTSLVMAASVAVAVEGTQPAQATTVPATSSAPTKPPCPDDRPDEVSASIAARLCGQRVEVMNRRSETTQVWAEPGGGFTAEAAMGPVRFQDAAGAWVPVDVTLERRPDGSVAPKAHPRGVVLSGAKPDGDNDLVTLGRGDEALTLGWRGLLPEPVLEGTKATYLDVRPGIDLVVEVNRTSFEQFLIVKDRGAAAQLRDFALPLRSGRLTPRATAAGGLELVNPAGTVRRTIPEPYMWDAAVDPQSGEHLRRAKVGMRLTARGSGRDLVLTPDRDFLDDPNLQFPVTVDPTPSPFEPNFDAFVQTGYTSDQSGSTDLKLGTYDGGTNKARSFLSFHNLSYLAGATISSATLSLFNYHSWSCTDRQWNAWRTNFVNNTVRWSNNDSYWVAFEHSAMTTIGYSGCAGGYVNISVKDIFQTTATNGWTTANVGLRANSETDNLGWKRFYSSEHASYPPKVTLTYNAPPTVGTRSTTPTSACVAGGYIASRTPTLHAVVSDLDGGSLTATFEWKLSGGSATSVPVTGVPSGTTASTTLPLLTEGSTYEWRVQSKDSANLMSAWSSWCPFTVDVTAPGAPTVSSTAYPDDGQWHGAYNQAGIFTFTPAAGTTDLGGYTHQLDVQTSPTTVNATGVHNASITPLEDGTRTLTVRAKDKAGNLSSPTNYVFKVGRARLAQPIAGANVVKRMKLQVEGDPTLTRVTFQYRRGPGSTLYDVPLANLTTASGAAVAAYPVTLASLSGNAIWTAADTLGPVGGAVQVRACLWTASDSACSYQSAWVSVTVDSNGDGAAGTDVGPGSVNLLTGDYGVESTDVDEFGLDVSRVASSREPRDGWLPQGERLTANQQQVSTNTTGFVTSVNASIARVTNLGQGGTTDSLRITPLATQGNGYGPQGDTYAALGSEAGFNLGMQAGKRYRLTGWIFVPTAAGLNPSGTVGTTRGQRFMCYSNTPGGVVEVDSTKAMFTEGWQQLQLDFAVPANATAAICRIYNGFPTGLTTKVVYWDNLSVKELVAPFGPQWTGGVADAAAGSDFTSLEFPTPDLAKVNAAGGGWLTFSKSTTGTFFPQPGAESLSLVSIDANTYELRDLDGTVVRFTKPTGSTKFVVTSTWITQTQSNTTTSYVYNTTDSRALVSRVVNPAEPGVTGCAVPVPTVPGRGCEVLEYVYATSTTATPSVFGDVKDQVKAVKIWSWDPAAGGGAGAMTAIDVATYAYDDLGRLREVWDPRVSPPLKTTYEYDGVGRVTTVGGPGELPWRFDYGAPDVGAAAVRWNFDETTGTTIDDASPNNRDGVLTGGEWRPGQGSGGDVADSALWLNGSYSGANRAAGSGVNTSQSFTVSAWVNTTDDSTTTYRTAVSQDGANVSGFILQKTANQWSFTRTATDSTTTIYRALSTAAPKRGAWTHLTGVYDASAGHIRLYVNGVLNATTACACAWNAAGAFIVGKTKWTGGAYTDLWLGAIDDVRIYSGVLSAGQIANLAGDENEGRLIRVHRAALQQGSPTVEDGEIGTKIVYSVPLTTAAGGPYNLDFAAISTWAQKDLPTDATAIFGPEDESAVTVASATASNPGSAGYAFATVHYLNASGQEVNTATPGGHIDTSEYDKFGNVVRTLEATSRELALGTLPDSNQIAADLGLPLDSGVRAQLLSTYQRYSEDGLDLLETTGPVSKVALESDLVDDDASHPTLPAGSETIARAHTVNVYDEGKPDGATYHLLTTTTSGGQVDGYGDDADVRVSKNGYNPINGSVSGWVLKAPTQVITDAGTGGTNLTGYIVYDAAGRATKSWGIGSNGNDSRARIAVFYTAGTNPADSRCSNKLEWAGQPCVTMAGGPITGAPVGMPTELSEKWVKTYSRWGEPTLVWEGANGKYRETLTEYDSADRIKNVTLASDDGTTSVPTVTTDYDPLTGDVTVTHMGAATITREYDKLGRLYRYTDADGAVTTNEFDRFGKPTKVTDSTGNSTFGYDRVAEPRGFLTSITDSVAGAFGASYTPDGQIKSVTYPGGLVRTDTFDANQERVGRSYGLSGQEPVWSETVTTNSFGQAMEHNLGQAGSKAYRYDRLGRLIKAEHTSLGVGGCLTRTYTYDNRTNRDVKHTYLPAGDGSCRDSGTPDAEDDHSYDSADRLVDTGYAYDAFGRTTATPDGLTLGYFVNDLVASQQTADTRQNFTLDPAHRFRAFTTEAYVDGNWVNATSKLNHYGDDSDDVRWIVEDTTLGTLTRNVSGPDGDLAATTSNDEGVRLQLTSLRGDVVMTIDPTLTTPEAFDYDEFGVPAVGQENQRYGWLGGKQRSAEALGGVILMGVRLYSPAIGRFLQPDPVAGGSSTAYDYCNADPVNCTDLAGTWPNWSAIKNVVTVVAKVAEVVSYIPGPIGAAAAAVSAVSYAATGNWAKAGEMALVAAAGLVGANTAVKAGIALAKGASRVGARALQKSATRIAGGFKRSCNSFDPDTPVLMADGTHRPISQLHIGDYVTAIDSATGQTSAQPVVDVIVGQGSKHLIDIDLDGDITTVLTATAEHPIWVDGRGWANAKDIKPGEVVVTADGLRYGVRQVIDRGWISGQTVYNLNVGDVHTYAVGVDASYIVVHNASSCSIAAHNVPEKGGVYVIHFRDGTKYVGMAKNMHKRVHKHFTSRRSAVYRAGRQHRDIDYIDSYQYAGRYNHRAVNRFERAVIQAYGGPRGGTLLNRQWW